MRFFIYGLALIVVLAAASTFDTSPRPRLMPHQWVLTSK